jgi:FtsZ-binding cell division protein ZapB
LHGPILHVFRVEFLEVENKNLKDETKALKDENKSLKDENKNLKDETKSLKEENDEAKRKLEVYYYFYFKVMCFIIFDLFLIYFLCLNYFSIIVLQKLF